MVKKVILYTLLGLLILGGGLFANEYMKLRAELFEVTQTKKEYVRGNPDGNLTIVYFSDYECPACREFDPILSEAVKEDGNIKLVQRPSAKDEWYMTLTASVYAAGKQNKFAEMNNLILENWPIFSEEKLFELATGLGLDTKQLSRDMKSKEVRQEIASNRDYLKLWNLRGFPALIIWPKKILLPANTNAMSKERLLDEFKDARSFF
ncbi:MAG: thioredoxin domain-containing protein [Alphaproteobacteria bacterium]|nr:thioredoxin domain-containing protein [Alphaproteobacteria bacterium]